MMRPSLANKTAMATSALFLAAILAVGLASLNSFRSQLTNVLIAEQDTLVDRIANNVDQKLVGLKKVLAASAADITDADVVDSDAAQRYLDRNTGLYAAFDRSIFLFSAEGSLLAERPYRSGRRGDNASWRPYMRDTIQQRRPVLSEPFTTNVGDGNMVLVATTPVFARDGRFIAILTGSIGLTQPGMLGNVAQTVIGKTGYLFITTADGKLIMHPDRERLSQQAFAPGSNRQFTRALDGIEGTQLTSDADGREALVSYRRVKESRWIVGAVYPADEAFRPVDALVRRFIVFLLLACGLVLAATWAMTRFVMRPLVSLTSHLRSYLSSDARISPLPGDTGSGEIHALTAAFNRLTSRLNEREDALIETMRSYRLITENSTDLITKHAPGGVIVYASPVAEAVLGVPHTSLIGRSMLELVHPDDHDAVRACFNEVHRENAPRTIVYRARHDDQHYVWLETTLKRMTSPDGEETQDTLCISRNIADRKRVEDRLYDLARTDHLTALPNRFLLEERFCDALAQARREGSLLSILLIDIDRFKNINDTLGHGMGDALLKLAASKLKACIRECDTLARWGGDEFVLLLPGLQSVETVTSIAQRSLEVLKQPFCVDGEELHVSASIGASTSMDANLDAETMLRHADTAMYKAKSRGGDCMVMYSSEMSAGARNRLSMENALFQAIGRGELRLHYQPQISARTGRLAGVEALIRWQHPEQGLVLPGQFIPIAEETGLIGAIGEWVLDAACMQMRTWYRRGLPRIPVAVNLSSRQFRQQPLVGTIRAALERSGLEPELLEVELTESLLMDDVTRSKSVLAEVKALGVSIALDDFGTGCSSLSYLRGFQLDTLKIDRTFTAELPGSEVNASIVRATIGLAKGLRLRTIAEGVETRAQADFLAQHGCDLLQGYLFARPMAPDAFLPFALASPTHLIKPALQHEV